MRRSALILACGVLLLLGLPVALNAQFTYTNSNGTLTITGYTGLGGEVAIPDTIDGLPVTSIGDAAFESCDSLTSVVIGNSVSNIGNLAFYYCTRLTSVTIPNSVISIGDDAFYSCINLASLAIPDSVASIGIGAFRSCVSLTNVSIPAGVTSIGVGAFEDCANMMAITVDPLNSIYSSVDGVLFNESQSRLVECPGRKAGSYTIPTGVTSIGAWAFRLCRNLTSVTIPDGVLTIEEGAFSGCPGLTNIAIPNSLTDMGWGAFASCRSLTSVALPNSLASIPGNAFSGCTHLTNVTIPSSVASIDALAFANCTGLTNVTLGIGVTNFAIKAFSGCTNLTAIAVDLLNPSYSSVQGLLFGKSQTTLLLCPEGRAGDYTIPESVGSIGLGAFSHCIRLSRVMVPNSVTNIEDYAFQSCPSLTGLYFSGNAPNLGLAVLYFVNATVYHLPGATGWAASFGGRPTAPWVLPNPVILTTPPRFGPQTNGFGFVVSWATNAFVVVEACGDLALPDWSPVGTNTLVDGWSYFSDPQWTNHPRRFYRVGSP